MTQKPDYKPLDENSTEEECIERLKTVIGKFSSITTSLIQEACKNNVILSPADEADLAQEFYFAHLSFVESYNNGKRRLLREIESGVKDAADPDVILRFKNMDEGIQTAENNAESLKKQTAEKRDEVLNDFGKSLSTFVNASEELLKSGINISKFDSLFQQFQQLKTKLDSTDARDESMISICDDIRSINSLLDKFTNFLKSNDLT